MSNPAVHFPFLSRSNLNAQKALSNLNPANIFTFVNEKFKINTQIYPTLLNKSYKELFPILEQKTHLMAISIQVHLSEALEYLAGIRLSQSVLQFRGFLLNLERVMNELFILHWFSYFINDRRLNEQTYKAYSEFLTMLEKYWDNLSPRNIICPGGIKEPQVTIDSNKVKGLCIRLINSFQKFIRRMEKNKIYAEFSQVKTPTSDLLKEWGISGPLTRTVNILPYGINLHTKINTSTKFLQYAYDNNNTLQSLLKVTYSELFLSLNRMVSLISEDYKSEEINFPNIINGEVTSTFLFPLGEAHLTLRIADNNITYFNYLFPYISNLFGFQKMLENYEEKYKPIFLLFFNPEVIVSGMV